MDYEERFNRAIDRFWKYVTKGKTEHACWSWSGPTNGPSKSNPWAFKYAKLFVVSKLVFAHRFSWMIHNTFQEIPKGKIVMHTCDNPKCTNPKHLKLGTLSENTLDSVKKGRWNKSRPIKKVSYNGVVYESAADAAKQLNMNVSSVRVWLWNKTKGFKYL